MTTLIFKQGKSMLRMSAAVPVFLAMMTITAHCAGGSVDDTVAHARALRQQASSLAGADATVDQLQQAASLLEAAQREIKDAELATGNPWLRLEKYNVLIQLAAVASRQRRTEEALAALDQARMVVWAPAVAQMLRDQTDFDTVRKDPRFQAMLSASALPERLWKGPASDRPYKETLTVEERIAGLTQFWAEARHSFVYFDKVADLDWDQVYMDYLPKVMAAQTTRDYYLVMRQLAALLKDGHTNVWAPGELNSEFEAVPPLRMALVEGHVLVAFVDDASLRKHVHIGDELLAIDGMPVHDYAKKYVDPLISAGAPQDRDFKPIR
jgi:carboxyl-terminal processing protease